MNRSIRLFLAVVLFCFAPVSFAKLLTWHLQDVKFEDGGTASGFFVFDPTSTCPPGKDCRGLVPELDITLVTPSDPGEEPRITRYGMVPVNDKIPLDDQADLPSYSESDGRARFFFSRDLSLGIGSSLSLAFDSRLPVAGGTIPLRIVDSHESLFSDFPTFMIHYRNIVSGSVTTIPEPAAVAFLGVACVLLMARARCIRRDVRPIRLCAETRQAGSGHNDV